MTERPTYHGEELLSADEYAVLLGVPVDELTACLNAQRDLGDAGLQSVRIPGAWTEQGRSRVDIYRQATGRNDYEGALEFWRSQRPTNRDDTPGGTE